eukprot:TRINITY_DN9700_c0_g1_i1.p1 TRINITY_DN9700_c0_g1~~TRINITY_DN9700_c0_g1_i1.p1  ORF type:complete len:294 (-),score=41.39 TRINITY_DN9700_c0_g1_i1:728-1609(-)
MVSWLSFLHVSDLKQCWQVSLGLPLLIRAQYCAPLEVWGWTIDDRLLSLYAFAIVLAGGIQLYLKLTTDPLARRVGPHPPNLEDIPNNACYYCIRRPAMSKCGGCRLVYYCGRFCQMQAWRKHRHVCGAASAATNRIQLSSKAISPSQWRALQEYTEAVRELLVLPGVIPASPAVAARVLCRIAAYVSDHPELVCQEMADSAWAAATSMRNDGTADRLHMAWAWGFLEATVESGSADNFLLALGIGNGRHVGQADLGRVNRWMRRGLCQALLMLTRKHEVGAFLRSAPRVAMG